MKGNQTRIIIKDLDKPVSGEEFNGKTHLSVSNTPSSETRDPMGKQFVTLDPSSMAILSAINKKLDNIELYLKEILGES